MARPFVVRPGERDPVWSLGGRFELKLDSRDVEGRVSLVEAVAYRSTEPPMHIHSREDEAWYVLDGQMTFHVDGQVIVATVGCFAFAPRGLAHAFTVDVEPTRILVLATPGGFEHFALELGVPASSATPPADLAVPSPEVLAPVADRYGIQVVGPPLRARGG
jgi:quercetin dioxygenase-like cupin family protein